MNILNLPNLITSLRIILLPPALYLFLQNRFLPNLICLILVIVMEFSDLFDGMAARKLNQITDLGKILDPFADHIYRLSFFLFFFIQGLIPLWMFMICFYRDSLVLNLRVFAASSRKSFEGARWSGKFKAVAQSIIIILFILIKMLQYYVSWIWLEKVYYISMLLVTLITLWSALDYFWGIFLSRQKKI